MSMSLKGHRKWRGTEWQLFIMAMLGVAFLAVFAYAPMYGILLAFRDGDGVLNVQNAIVSAPWCGFGNFKALFQDSKFINIFINTITLNFVSLLVNFPAPILFALFLNEVAQPRFKKIVQTLSIVPHFISWTIFGGIVLILINANTGVINPLLELFGLSNPENPVDLATENYIWGVIIVSSLIKNVGWGSIIYMAAIAGVGQEMYEAATIDGAGRFQKMFYVTFPSISPTIVTFFILNFSRLLNNSFEEFYIFQNSLNINRSEVLVTYIYKQGIGSTVRRYSYAAAMGLLNSIVGMLLLVIGNVTCRKLTGKGIF